MTPEQRQRVKSLFDRVLDQPPAARDAFLKEAAESSSVLAEVRKLLGGDALATAAPFSSPSDAVSGQYHIVSMLGRVGMSVEETAEALGVHPNTVIRDWGLAKVWLKRELSPKGANAG
jgi:hypothetical protein